MTFEHHEELKTCPFCFSESYLGLVVYPDEDTYYNPQCSVCPAGWNENYETEEEAIEAWNNRWV